MKIKQKRGISLIVLAITIVVMIILATVVILSLDSSNIIERANEAKKATNLANLKEAANVALAEYHLEVSLGNIDGKATSANSYVKAKLEEQGMDTSTMTVTAEGKILTELTGAAVKFIEAGVEVGATVTGYDLSSNTKTTYATTGNENTAPEETETDPTTQNVARANTLTWKYIGISEEGEALIALDAVSGMPTMKLSGKGGFVNGPKELDLACDALYSSSMGKARSIDYEDVIRLLEYTGPVGKYYDKDRNEKYLRERKTIGELVAGGETALTDILTPDGRDINSYYVDCITISKTSSDIKAGDVEKNLVYQNTTYWLASSCVGVDFYSGDADFYVRSINNSSIDTSYLVVYGFISLMQVGAVRPVVSLASDIQITYNGTTVALS